MESAGRDGGGEHWETSTNIGCWDSQCQYTLPEENVAGLKAQASSAWCNRPPCSRAACRMIAALPPHRVFNVHTAVTATSQASKSRAASPY